MTSLLNLDEPEFINDEGFRWHRAETFKERAVGLGVSVFIVCDADDSPQAWVTIDNKSNKVIHEGSGIEATAFYLDGLKFLKDSES